MSKYFVDGQDLTDIADAIREGLASTASLEFPDDFVTGIGNISGTTPTGEKTINISANGTTTEDVTQYATAKVVAAVPNTYVVGDEGKVVDNGALVAQTSSSTTINGTFDTTLINSFAVNVSGGVTPTGTKQINVTFNGTTTTDVTAYATAEVIANVPASAVDSGTKNITSNGSNQDVVGYAAVNVNVPNSYSSGDEGKVVYNGALVSQTSASVNTDGTYDTTLINSMTVSVGGGSSGVTQGTFEISAADASAHATSEYTVSSITCQNGYIIVAQRVSTNGQYWWVYCPIMTNSQYLNGTNIQGGVSLANHTSSNMAKLVNNHPVIKGTNASFPLIAGTYDIIYW